MAARLAVVTGASRGIGRALTERLRRIGFRRVEDLDADEINRRYFKDRSDRLRVTSRLGHLMSAEV